MNIENVFCARTKAKLRIEYVILITIWYLDFAHSDLRETLKEKSKDISNLGFKHDG